MITNRQSRGSFWMGLATVLALTAAVPAQLAGTAAVAGPSKLETSDITAGTAAVGGQSGGLIEVDWINLGYAMSGVEGPPKFKGTGTISAGSRAKLILKGAAPNSPAVLFVSLDSAPQPFKGGTLIPAAPAYTLVLATDATGGIELAISASANLPAGLDLVMQFAVADVGGPQGVSLSNALQTSTH